MEAALAASALVALFFAAAGPIDDHDLGTIEGSSIAGAVVLVGVGAVAAKGVGMAFGRAIRVVLGSR